MQDDFELEAVLSVITGINCTDDFYKVYELFCFLFEDSLLNPKSIGLLKDTATRHILSIHPELSNVVFDNSKDIYSWVNEQKVKFGEKITISVVGEPIIVFNKKSYHSAR